MRTIVRAACTSDRERARGIVTSVHDARPTHRAAGARGGDVIAPRRRDPATAGGLGP